MSGIFNIVVALLVCNLNLLASESLKYNNSTLKLVHVIFRHGNRTPDTVSLYPNDPYLNETYYPFGHGQLTNAGKQREYRLGKYIRRRYDNFLGDTYTPEILDAVSTGFNRTKMSLELVLAGLFPPKHTALEWERELNWQPIPYNYLSSEDNHLLSLALFNCDKYAALYQEYLASEEGQRVLRKYTKLFRYLSEHTGMNVTTPLDVFLLHAGLTAEEDWGFALPEWTESVFPKILDDAVIDHYILGSATSELKQLSGGFLLKKIILDTMSKINNNLSPPERKIFLYSAHDFTMSYLLNAMEVFFPHTPPYGTCIFIEVHEINGVNVVKIFYQDYSSPDLKMLRVPGCKYNCPFDKFLALLAKNLPQNDDACDIRKEA